MSYNDHKNDYVSTTIAATILGIHSQTMRTWEEDEIFFPDYITKGGHRRYETKRIVKLKEMAGDRKAYAPVLKKHKRYGGLIGGNPCR